MLQQRLESKIRIIGPAIDMIELISARGNTSLESAVTLTKSLRWDIQALGTRLPNAASDEEDSRRGSSKAKSAAQKAADLKTVTMEINGLLERIEDAVPLINLAVTTSGVRLSTTLPTTVSPSRLLQASMFLSAGDAHYMSDSCTSLQIGPTFTLSVYMLFTGHVRPQDEEGLRSTTWKEVMHKAKVKLLRTSLDNISEIPRCKAGNGTQQSSEQLDSRGQLRGSAKGDEFAYQLLIVEDLDDGRVHTFEADDDQPTRFDEVNLAGIREVVPIHEVSKVFYADTGKILNIGNAEDANNPILLIKRDVTAPLPRAMLEVAAMQGEGPGETAGRNSSTDKTEDRSCSTWRPANKLRSRMDST